MPGPLLRRTGMSDQIRLSAVTLDCPDPSALAEFYAAVIGGAVTCWETQWATVQGPKGRIDSSASPATPRRPGPACCLTTWDGLMP